MRSTLKFWRLEGISIPGITSVRAFAPGLSSAAAKLVGIGRPALSNYVNGHVGTTPSMASRIEAAFGVPARKLLEMQAAFDAAAPPAEVATSLVAPYVPPLIQVKAREIEAWADRNIGFRSRLAVLLRTLVHSTGRELSRVDFPGNDDAERPGWDGVIEAGAATPWIPIGSSGWEFGTDKAVDTKATADIAKAERATSKGDRAKTTFVFVTPREWKAKDRWLAANRARGQWKDVIAYDSSDIEQWLEQSISGQIWIGTEIGRPVEGVRALDRCWKDWSSATTPPLPGSLFDPAIASSRTLASSLTRAPLEPVVLAADSPEEALAFLAQFFSRSGEANCGPLGDQVLVFDRPGVLTKLSLGRRDFIAVTASREVELEIAPLAGEIRSIVIRPRNAGGPKPTLVLEPLTSAAFSAALRGPDWSRDTVTELARKSGRSLTILRRTLAILPTLRQPEWARDTEIPRHLIPFWMAGTWSFDNQADRELLQALTGGVSAQEVEVRCQRLTAMVDAPIWSVRWNCRRCCIQV
ncbi:MAG: helix-turn-helix domain-containing protein [Gemmatimonadetes bacterium]|nr:helix-turn-helix domain-containing protein [Gemmatimonadota bacterium]